MQSSPRSYVIIAEISLYGRCIPLSLYGRYIPPYWPHHVIARSYLSVSLSVWSASASGTKYAELERLPLPWESEWSDERVTVAATQARWRHI